MYPALGVQAAQCIIWCEEKRVSYHRIISVPPDDLMVGSRQREKHTSLGSISSHCSQEECTEGGIQVESAFGPDLTIVSRWHLPKSCGKA